MLAYRPPRIAMTLVLLAIIANTLTSVGNAEIYASTLIAALLATGGFTIMMIAWWQFQVGNVAVCPTEETTRLITTGVFHLTRNPMYLGLILMLFGLAVWIGTLPFYAAAATFFVIIQKFFCPYEEEKLRQTFGPEYENYATLVRRWI